MIRWWRLSFTADAESEPALILALHECGTLGVEALDGRLIAWFPESRDPLEILADVMRGPGRPPGAFAVESSDLVPDGRWHERWVEGLRPLPVGVRLLIAPGPGAPPSAGPGRVVVRLTPGRAFGTGEHATTCMCLEIIEEILRPRDEMLDVGTGSGILAIAARLLGAALVVAIDTDQEAAMSAQDGAALNETSDILVVAGCVNSLRPRRFDLVAANLTGATLLRLLPDLAARTGRAAVISGILREEEDEILAAARAAGLDAIARRRRDDWTALLLERVRR